MKKTPKKRSPAKKKITKLGGLTYDLRPEVEGRHKFFENRNRVGAEGLKIKFDKLLGVKLFFPAEAIEALYYISLDAVDVKWLENLQSETSFLEDASCVTKEKVGWALTPHGEDAIVELRKLGAVPED